MALVHTNINRLAWFNRMVGLSILLFLAYIVASIIGAELLSDSLSIATAIVVMVALLLHIDQKSDDTKSWWWLAAVCLTWGGADLIWLMVAHFSTRDPNESIILMYVYALPNLLLLGCACTYFISNLKRWHKLQLMADSATLVVIVVPVIFFSLANYVDYHPISIHEEINYTFYLVSNLVTLSMILVMAFSTRMHKIGLSVKWAMSGFIIYSLTDSVYVYEYFMDSYIANQWLDRLYLLALVCFSIAAWLDRARDSRNERTVFNPLPENLGKSYRLLFIQVLPILFVVFDLLPFESLYYTTVITALYVFVSNYIQQAMKNEMALKEERIQNEALEQLINERTKALLQSNASLEILASRDTLTGLNNRRSFIDKLDALIDEKRTSFAVLYMDLDNFKIINDIHGHGMGDRILTVISERLKDLVQAGQLIARVGGDEFALIEAHPERQSKEDLMALCEKIIGVIEERIYVQDYVFCVGVSVGVSRYPEDDSTREGLVKYADLAMYQAKKAKDVNKYVFYTSRLSDGIHRKHSLQMLLKSIDYDESFELHFQPQFDTCNQKLIGAEALLRWNHPDYGDISPTEFIPIAEETESIIKIGKWVINQAFQQISKWQLRLDTPLVFGINLSPLQFSSVDFFPFLHMKFEEHQINPNWIDFEITENCAMNSSTVMEEIFTALSGMGAQLSVDDFGTGYSSLSYIKRFDIDQLKIAKELIDHIVINSEEQAIIKAIIRMAQSMGLKTIAEGVETQEQYDILKRLGCDAIQGYYLGAPLTVTEFEQRFMTAKQEDLIDVVS